MYKVELSTLFYLLTTGAFMQSTNPFLKRVQSILFFCFFLFPTLKAELPVDEATEKLRVIHEKLHLIHGSLLEEYPEQLMTAMYLPADAKVLELGGNVGRNSCVIASLLNQNTFVTMESCEEYAGLLKQNRNYNRLKFHIEAAALSKTPLIQSGWETIPSHEVLPGFFRVRTLSFVDLKNKYGIEFDTLIVDCEGALYYILQDFPEMLEKIKLVIIENDFKDIQHMQYVHSQFTNHGLQLVYNQPGGWGPCYDYFYQVWKK
jgi:FkbM family methyltransferase